MRILRHAGPVAGILLATALLAGCGAGTTGGLYGTASSATAPAAPATTGAASAAAVQTASVTVNGQQETVLTDSRGYTLYYFDSDTSSTATCTGGCAQAWPPLTASASSVPAPSGVSGTLSVLQGANGNQVAYNGHPLYTYSGDSGPGQAHGDGMQGKWHVATLSTPVNSNGNSGGYGAGG
jgi:predicted lipoprotein with Yx(FWY)xxD motif